MKHLSPGFLTIPFCLIGMVALIAGIRMQGNARVVNYTGIVRGATQRLVKQEMNGVPNDELIQYLDDIVSELAAGVGGNGLIALSDETYQTLMKEMALEWNALKDEIGWVRQGQPSRRLYELSESYFDLANQAVSAAERYSEAKVTNFIGVLLCLNGGIFILFILLRKGEMRQKKAQMALDLAESANKAKSEFLSRISHEIRTPMNGITGMTAIAYRFVDDPERMTDCLNKIELSAGYLLSLLNDVLDMSRIESGKLQLDEQPFDLTELLNQIHEMFREKAEENSVSLNISCGELDVVRVIGDHLRISQVLVNLVSNALKFTPPGGCVTLEAGQTVLNEEQVFMEFAVTDTGIGIDETFQ